MATHTFTDVRRDEYIQSQKRTNALIARLAEGEVPADLPRGDPMFQRGIIALIGTLRGYKVDAGKLAVVREVFGGKV